MLFLCFLRSQKPRPLQLLSTVKSVHKKNFPAFVCSVCKCSLMLMCIFLLLIVIHSILTIGFAWTEDFVIFPFLTQVCISFAGRQFLLKCICQIDSIFLLFFLGPVVTLTERPDPPTNLEMTDQTERSVRLMWIPGDENNSPTQSKKILEGFNFP